jgi:hypothetical protein
MAGKRIEIVAAGPANRFSRSVDPVPLVADLRPEFVCDVAVREEGLPAISAIKQPQRRQELIPATRSLS